MKSKAPLALMEQIVMVLVFALAAALCLQMFVFSSQVMDRCEAKDRAVLAVQNAAEVWKMNSGDAEKCAQLLGGESDADGWQIGYDADWNQTDDPDAVYWVRAIPVATDDILVGCADISAQTADGDCLFQVSVAWQEVSYEE